MCHFLYNQTPHFVKTAVNTAEINTNMFYLKFDIKTTKVLDF